MLACRKKPTLTYIGHILKTGIWSSWEGEKQERQIYFEIVATEIGKKTKQNWKKEALMEKQLQ